MWSRSGSGERRCLRDRRGHQTVGGHLLLLKCGRRVDDHLLHLLNLLHLLHLFHKLAHHLHRVARKSGLWGVETISLLWRKRPCGPRPKNEFASLLLRIIEFVGKGYVICAHLRSRVSLGTV